jgi:MFS superfamily sulfate permease-like transporter
MFLFKEKTQVFDDLKSGLTCSLVALPLCLGIALASGAPLLSGLIAGIIGGMVIGLLSGSHVSVSGPAAGLAVIVFGAIQDLGAFRLFLVSVFLAGCIQLTVGLLKLGGLAKYINHAVIEGMLASIGILIILKQLPYALGALNFKGYSAFVENFTYSSINSGAVFIGLLCISLFIVYNSTSLRTKSIFKWVPFSVFLVVISTFLSWFFKETSAALDPIQFVNLGDIGTGGSLLHSLQHPDFSNWFSLKVIRYGFVIAAVASIETLLCIEAGDKMDPFSRKTSANRELKAQGVGNMLSALVGGLPITSVIVRTSVNIHSGAKTKLSSIFHGILLLISIVIFPQLIVTIPLAVLACILLNAGFNLAHPKLMIRMFSKGLIHSVPFFLTIIMVVSTDLLMGVVAGQVSYLILSRVMDKSKVGNAVR